MTTLQTLEQEGWTKAAAVPRRLVCSIEGLDKTGKSHLAMSAPGPIAYIDLDIGTEGVVQKCEKEYLLYKVEQPKQLGSSAELMDKFKDVWSDVQTQIASALKLGEGTLVIDTFTEVYDICRLSHFGKMAQVEPHRYGVCYADMREIIRLANASKMNVILLHRMGLDFKTGELTFQGWKQVPSEVQAVLRTQRSDTDMGPVFSAEVRTCRHKPELMGKVLVAGQSQGPREIPFSLNFEALLGYVHG